MALLLKTKANGKVESHAVQTNFNDALSSGNLALTLAESVKALYHVTSTADADFFAEDDKMETAELWSDEEKQLLQNSFKHIDCSDFPFEEVLSLDDALKKDATEKEFDEMSCCSIKRIPLGSCKPEAVISENSKKAKLQRQQGKATSGQMTKKNRPPLLKCPTWPDYQLSDGNSDNSLENCPTPITESASISKLDSPSFYSAGAIDFSAISHLSEEHDKLMAQENAEKSLNKHSYISDSTKEKLYGKATQRRALAKGKVRKSVLKVDGKTETLFSVSSVPIESLDQNQANFQNYINQGNNNRSKKQRKFAIGKTKKSAKALRASGEKSIRKGYSSLPSVTVTSVPIASFQNEDSLSSILIDSNPLSESDEVAGSNQEDDSSNHALAAEKQPLPPEGFKISRYPLKNKSQKSTTTSVDSDHDQAIELGLCRLIADLRKQLNQAEEKIAEAESQAREWREFAQRTQRAVEVITSQIEAKKKTVIANSLPSEIPVSTVSRDAACSWNVENRTSYNGSNDTKLQKHSTCSNHVIQQFLRGNTKVENGSDRKRALAHEEQNEVKRQRSASGKKKSRLPSVEEDKNQSLLAWLANSEPENDVDYMTYLEVPSESYSPLNFSSAPIQHAPESNDGIVFTTVSSPILSHRPSSHDDVKEALRAKVNTATTTRPADVAQNDTAHLTANAAVADKPSAQFKTAFDRILESFTNAEPNVNYVMEPCQDEAKTPSSQSLQSPEIPSPIFAQSLSESELSLGNDDEAILQILNRDQLELFKRVSSSDNELNKVLEDSDLLTQLDSILDF